MAEQKGSETQARKVDSDHQGKPSRDRPILADGEKKAGEENSITISQPDENLEVNKRLVTFTGWLVCVGIVQFVALFAQAVIFRQTLKENRKLIHASQCSADAAKLSADAAIEIGETLIGAERAWLVPVDIKPPALFEMFAGGNVFNCFTFDLVNQGRTVARLTGPIKARFRSLPRDVDLADTPDYGGMGATTPEAVFGRVLAPGERSGLVSIPLGEHIDKNILASIESQQTVLHVYASVTYYDSYDKKRELQFGYMYKPARDPEPARWVLIGKLEYNRHT